MRADRALNTIQAQMLDDIVIEKEVFDARIKAKNALLVQLSGLETERFPGMVGEDIGYDEDEYVDDPMGQGRKYLGEAQAPTVPLEEGPNPFPMLEPPLG